MKNFSDYFKGSYQLVIVVENDFDYKILETGATAFDLLDLDRSKFTLLDCSANSMREKDLQTIADSMQESGIPGIVLSPDPNVVYDRLHHLPHFALLGVDLWQSSAVYNIAQPRQYAWSCLNRQAHRHRIMNWLAVRNVPNGVCTMHATSDYSHQFPLDAEYKQQWQQLKSTLPDISSCHADLGMSHDAYSACYINLITETVMNPGLFVSEKTWKPIASGQFFIVVGGVGTIAYLRSLGVDVFDDIIDQSYDSEPSWRRRIELANASLKKFLEQDLDAIWSKTYERRLSNQTRFFSLDFFRQHIDSINDAILSY